MREKEISMVLVPVMELIMMSVLVLESPQITGSRHA
jgi:hypothetical protein